MKKKKRPLPRLVGEWTNEEAEREFAKAMLVILLVFMISAGLGVLIFECTQ